MKKAAKGKTANEIALENKEKTIQRMYDQLPLATRFVCESNPDEKKQITAMIACAFNVYAKTTLSQYEIDLICIASYFRLKYKMACDNEDED